MRCPSTLGRIIATAPDRMRRNLPRRLGRRGGSSSKVRENGANPRRCAARRWKWPPETPSRGIRDGRWRYPFAFIDPRRPVVVRPCGGRPCGRVGGRPARASPAPLAPCASSVREKLDAGVVGGQRHDAAERVNLAHQMAFPQPANRRIATHLPYGLDVVRQRQRPGAGSRRRQRRLGAGVTAADDDDIVCGGVSASQFFGLRRFIFVQCFFRERVQFPRRCIRLGLFIP